MMLLVMFNRLSDLSPPSHLVVLVDLASVDHLVVLAVDHLALGDLSGLLILNKSRLISNHMIDY